MTRSALLAALAGAALTATVLLVSGAGEGDRYEAAAAHRGTITIRPANDGAAVVEVWDAAKPKEAERDALADVEPGGVVPVRLYRRILRLPSYDAIRAAIDGRAECALESARPAAWPEPLQPCP